MNTPMPDRLAAPTAMSDHDCVQPSDSDQTVAVATDGGARRRSPRGGALVAGVVR